MTLYFFSNDKKTSNTQIENQFDVVHTQTGAINFNINVYAMVNF